nr:putative reverse transcriptase domain-containing protein [Tanacetum cinerariifolium]
MHKNPKTWSIAFSEVDRGCEAVENGFSECFNSVIVDVRHKSLITILEAIRVIVLERMNKMREITVKWNLEGVKDSQLMKEIRHAFARCGSYQEYHVFMPQRSGATNTGGSVNVQGCTHKTFMNGKPHPFNGTEGVVGLRRLIEKTELKSMMTTDYWPVTKIQRMEEELWTLTLKGDDIEAYNSRFHELALKCPDLVPNEKKKIKRYMKGFPERIKGNITSSWSTTLHDAITLAWELVEQAVQGKAARVNESNKRKWEEHQKNHPNNNNPNNHNHNHNNNNQHHQQNRRQEIGRAYAVTLAEGKGYNGNLPWCHRCKAHHQQGLCPPKCNRCNKPGHQEKDCQVRIPATGGNALQDVTCFSVLFDSGAERSFVFTEFTPFINISSVALNTSYEVELVDRKVVSTNTVLRGCTLALFNHIVRIPLPNGEILEIQGERPKKDLKSLSCIKADEKRLDDIHIVRDFSEVFINDLIGLPLVRKIEFRIDLIPGALPVVKSPYHLAPSEMMELSNQLKELQEKDPSKVESVKNWKTLESPIEIRSFLGLAGYYRRFIENFSKIAKPITMLTQKNKAYVWGDKQKEAFYILKEKLCNAPVLALPDGPNDFVVYCDASNQRFGCVLMQRGKIELLSDYECEIKYHPGKENFVADALSRKERLKPRRVRAMSMTIQSGLKAKILEAQGEASKDLKAPAEWLRGLERHFKKRDDGEIYFFDRVWIPSVGGIRKLIMDEAHTSRYSVHPGTDKMYYDLKDLYWWPGMKRDIAEYEKITIDLVTKFPKSNSRHDAIWVVVDRLTKSAHFLPIREDYKTKKLARIYINEIVARHGIPMSIILDRDHRFASHLWQALQKTLGTKLNMSIAYQPETDGQSERTIQILEDILRACVMDFGGSWDTHLLLVEFSYNKSYHKRIKCVPFEALYGRKCRSPVIWTEIEESQLIGPEIMQETTEKIVQIKEKLKNTKSRQKIYVDKRPMIADPDDLRNEIPKPISKMTEANRKRYSTNVRVMNYLLQAIPNDIYNSLDACKDAQETVDIQTKNAGYGGNYNRNAGRQNRNQEANARNDQFYNCNARGHYARDCPKPKVRDAMYFREQMLLAMKDEAVGTVNEEENDFMLDNAYSDETLKVLTIAPEWSRHVTIVHQTKDLHTADYTQLYDFLKYNQKEVIQNAVQNLRVQNVGNQNGLIGVQGNENQSGNGNLVAVRAEGNATGQNINQIRCYNCRGVADLDEIEEVNANCILMANLQQASTSDTQTDSAPVYDTDRSAEVHENCDDNEIFNMFTQEEQYIELLEPILESHQVPHNDNDVISEDTSVEQGGETVEQHPANFEETRALYESLYQNLAIKVKKVNLVNQKLKETNTDLTTELARFKNQERCFEISQEKYDKLERCYQQSVYQEQCLSKKINALHLSTGVFVPQTALSREEFYCSNNSKTANVSKSFLIPNEDLSDDTTPSVARKFLNEVISTILTLQRVVKQRITIETHNWASSTYQELHKIVRDENFPIVNQVDSRLQNFEIQFLKEAAKFVEDFKSLANEADASLAKHKALELEIEHLLKAIVSQDIMIIVQNESVVDTSDIQTELERTKERFENCIIIKETAYVKLWNDWYKKYTQNPLSQKLENENVELEFQVLNYARENAHLKATYKNLFDSISVTRTQTKTIIASLQNELQSNIYKNAKLRTQLFKKVSDQKDNTKNTSENTKFAKQPIVENLPKIGKTNALSKPVTSNSVSTPQECKGVNNDKVIAPGMFRINPS